MNRFAHLHDGRRVSSAIDTGHAKANQQLVYLISSRRRFGQRRASVLFFHGDSVLACLLLELLDDLFFNLSDNQLWHITSTILRFAINDSTIHLLAEG